MERILSVQFVNQNEDIIDADGKYQEGDDFRNDQSHPHAKEREKSDR